MDLHVEENYQFLSKDHAFAFVWLKDNIQVGLRKEDAAPADVDGIHHKEFKPIKPKVHTWQMVP